MMVLLMMTIKTSHTKNDHNISDYDWFVNLMMMTNRPQTQLQKAIQFIFISLSHFSYVPVSTGSSSSPSSLAACSLGRSWLAVKCRRCYPFSPSHGPCCSCSCSWGLEGYQNRHTAFCNLCFTMLVCKVGWDTKIVSNTTTILFYTA